jgi:methionyl-tRNA synthetase
MASRTLVTMALPYANGSIHLGHMVEAVQTDIYVRALKAAGRDVVWICASDTHGTPIEVNAAKAGVPPEQFVARFHAEHRRDYGDFHIRFDEFYTTHSPENERHARAIFEALREGGAIEKRSIEQLYCEIDQRFLPDRYVRGTCPKCGARDQYGDACENCGSTYEPTALIDPYCAICKDAGRGIVTPVRRSSTHYFVRLSQYQDFLRAWTSEPGKLQPEVKRSIDGWLEEPLKDWDISRDAPYFGFKIPGEEAKYFYVWLDAPVGYLSSTEHWARAQTPPRDVWDWWGEHADAEIIHFIGKDIVYFHTLFWPAMLHAAKRNVPAHVHVHGMLTVEGAKMSKSRGTFINAREYLDAGLDPEWLRYFYASNLGPSPSDIDLSLNELRNRVNGELLANIGNLANRALSLLKKNFDGQYRDWLPALSDPWARLEPQLHQTAEQVQRAYEAVDSREAVQKILLLSSLGNSMMQESQPWKLLKEDPNRAQQYLTLAVHIARVCARLIAPVVPTYATGVAGQTGAALDAPRNEWLKARVGDVKPLVRKIEDADLARLASRFVTDLPADTDSTAPAKQSMRKPGTQENIGNRGSERAAKADASKSESRKQKAESAPSPARQGEIDKDQFDAIDLRAGKILSAERIPKADKLLKLTVDLGEAAPRTILSGIAQHYAPEDLAGRVVAVVANLAPKELRGILSHGMILAAGGGARGLTVVELPGDVAPGSKVT